MQTVADKIKSDIRSLVQSWTVMKEEVSDIQKAYNSTDIQTELSGKADGDPVTVTTKLTKLEFINGITMVGELVDFFNNAAVTQGDYWSTCENIIYGNDAAVALLSEAVEHTGDRLLELATNIEQIFKTCNNILNDYNNNNFAVMVTNFSDEDVIHGMGINRSLLSSGITIVEQFKKFVNNEAVATADYKVTLADWVNVQ